ncbi:hypothetical protein [Kineococcus esterisolvens]|uniref:hypothetical protein n=1 Tax=unclassified Kineococcus TaxID=2621656 RepID=UPI003D7CFE03
MDTTRDHPAPGRRDGEHDEHDEGHDGELFEGWTLPDGTFEGFGAPLTRGQLVERFVTRCAAMTR